MPIYEYLCAACGGSLEYLARSRTDRPGSCPVCGSKRLVKQLSAFIPAAASPQACGGCAGAPSCPSRLQGGCGGGPM